MPTISKVYYGACDTGPSRQELYLYDSSGNLVWAGVGPSITPSDFAVGWSGTATPSSDQSKPYKDSENKSPSDKTSQVAFRVDSAKTFLEVDYDGTTYVMGLSGEPIQTINNHTGQIVSEAGYRSRQHIFATAGAVIDFIRGEAWTGDQPAIAEQDASYSHARNVVEKPVYDEISGNPTNQGENTMTEVNEILAKSYINLERDPVNDYHAASKHYVDTAIGGVNTTLTGHTGSAVIHVPTQNSSGYVFLSNATSTSAGTWTAYGTAGADVASDGAKLVTGGAVYAYVEGWKQTTVRASGTGENAASDLKFPTEKAVRTLVDGLSSVYSPTGHSHAASDITSGTLAAARLPAATDSAKGAVIVGTGLSVSSGTVSVDYATCKTGLGLGSAAYLSTGTGSGNVPVLDSNGKLSESVLPALAITDTFEAASQSAMLALSSAKKGDICIRSDLNKSFILAADGYSTLANWKELKTPTDAVLSVCGQTGAITQSQLGLVISSSNYLGLTASARDDRFPSEKAVSTYVEGKFASLGDAAECSVADTYSLDALEEETGLVSGEGLVAAFGDYTDSMTMAYGSNGSGVDATNDTKFVTAKAAKKIAEDAAASATAAAAKGKIFTITGNGSTTDFTCTHGLGISNILTQVYDSSGKQVLVATEKTATAVTFKFAAAPAANTTYTAVILGVAEAAS